MVYIQYGVIFYLFLTVGALNSFCHFLPNKFPILLIAISTKNIKNDIARPQAMMRKKLCTSSRPSMVVRLPCEETTFLMESQLLELATISLIHVDSRPCSWSAYSWVLIKSV